MSRFRLDPTSAQAVALAEYCAHARFVWNLAVEQHAWRGPARGSAPTYVDQARQLTEARAEFGWLRAGSQTVQQQALRDFSQAMSAFISGAAGRPTWRKAGRHDGFRIVAVTAGWIRRVSRKVGHLWVPKIGWVRFRLSRKVPRDARSYRVKRDRAGRWHVTFAVPPQALPRPVEDRVVGIDRGVAVTAALSTGEMLSVPQLSAKRRERLLRLRRRLARAARGSNRRARTKLLIARLASREVDVRNDWLERVTTDLARRFSVIRVENLNIRGLTRSARGTTNRPGRNVRAKAGLNREILAGAWGGLVRRLEQKAPGRVERTNPAFTSQRCSACGHVAAANRKSQAVFACVACRFTANADVNAAVNIAAGRAVTARGALQASARATNREPQLASFGRWVGIPGSPGEDVNAPQRSGVVRGSGTRSGKR